MDRAPCGAGNDRELGNNGRSQADGVLKYFQLDENSRLRIRNPNSFLFKVMKNEVLNWYRKERPITFESLTDEDLERRFADTSQLDDELLLRLCDDDGIDAKGMIPDHGIFGTGQNDVIDVLG